MTKKLLFTNFFIGLLFFTSNFLEAQNAVLNPDFETAGGSLNSWTHTTWNGSSGVDLRVDTGDNYAYMYGDTYMYQKVTNITTGLPYVYSINFKDLNIKQTTGIGFAIEKETSLNIPSFPLGATNLRDFCNSNSGLWWEFLSSDPLGFVTSESDGSYTYTVNLTLPNDATAIYVCLGTKGAIARLEVNTVSLEKDPNIKEVTFSVKDNTNSPVENAEIEVEGFSFNLLTDSSGEATTNLLLNTDYDFNVLKDYYQIYNSTVSVNTGTNVIDIQLEDLIEVKDVQTRISEYGDNATPYPIYAHLWNKDLNFTPQINQKLAENFDYIIGGGDISNTEATNLDIDAIKAIDDKFQVIVYQGGWSEKASNVEDQKIDLLYYRAGILSASINASQTSLVINTTPDNKGKGLVASETDNFITWIRIGDELMKILSVSSNISYPITVTVERGLGGTTPTSHTANQTVTAPLYTVAPVIGGNNDNLSYFDPVFGPRKTRLKDDAIYNARFKKQDGIWIDILVGLLGAQNMVGGNYTLWDHENNQTLTSEEINLKTKDALNDIYESFYARLGYYPTIYGNNVLYDQNYNASSRGFVMEKTITHPKGLDGFCHENSWGHMSDDSGGIDNDGDPVNTSDVFRLISKYNNGRFLEYYMGNTWISRCKAIALLAQRELPNQPMTINAGFKNQWFAYDLTDQQRYDFNKYAYASYLMSVYVDSENRIASRMGISPMTDDGAGNIDITVEPFFLYDIGVPIESNNYTNFTNYRVASNNLYARNFSKGLVLLNPFSSNMASSVSVSTITGNSDVYTNPENGQVVTAVQLGSRESMLLLNSSTASVNDKQSSVRMYPNPTNHILNIESSNLSALNSKTVEVKIYNVLGKSKVIKSRVINNKLSIDVSGLSSGLYIVQVEGINTVLKFVKQ